MKVGDSGQFHKPNLQTEDISSDSSISRKSSQVSSVDVRETMKSTVVAGRTTQEMNFLGQMLQSALQTRLSEPNNWNSLLRAALEALARMEDPEGEMQPSAEKQVTPSGPNTETTRMAELLRRRLPGANGGTSAPELKQAASGPSAPDDPQARLEQAKKLAQELKQPPAAPGPGFAGVLNFATENIKTKRPLQEKAVGLLEQAKSPEEAKQIAEALGGEEFKHQLVDDQLKDRLSQSAQKNNVAGLGYTQSAEQVAKNAEKIEKADGDKTVELSKDAELLRNASPEQKIKMIKELGKGFDGHDDKKCMAIDRILSSCRSKAEFDQVLNGAGGKDLLQHLNGDEAKQRINELCGMWGREDVATMPEVAKKFSGLMTDPAKQAEYSANRPPTSDEAKASGANIKGTPPDPAFDQAADAVKDGIKNKAYDVDSDQGSKVELIREQRRRELSGTPKLDYTSVTAQAEKITNASDDEIRSYKKKKPDEKISEDDRKDYVKDKMEELRKQTGLSEQSINDLVTRKMGNIYGQAAGEMASYGGQIVGTLKKELDEVVKTQGPNSPQAQQLKSRIENLSKNFDQSTKQLGQTSQTYHDLFPMPPSLSESIGKVFGVIGDIAASVLKFVPGWGQAFSEIYTAAKAIGQGDLVGGIAGFGGMVTGPGYREACHFVQRSSKGDVLDALGGLSTEMGGRIGEEAIKMGKNVAREDWGAVAGQLSQGAAMLAGVGGAAGEAVTVAKTVLESGRAAFTIADGISKGDGLAVLGGIAGGVGAFGAIGGTAGQVANEVSRDLKLARSVGVTIDSAMKGNIGGVLNGLGDAFSGISSIAGPKSPISGALGYAENGLAIAGKLSRGDFTGALSMGIGLASPFVTDQGVRNVMDSVQNALPSIDALAKGNLAGLGPLANQFGGLSSGIQNFAKDPNIQKLIIGIGQSNSLIQSIQKGDIAGLANTLIQKGGLMETLGGDGFSQAIREAGSGANDLLNSAGLRNVMDFTKSATDFVQNLAAGKTDQALNALSGVLGRNVPELQPLVPLAQAMAKGDFTNALKQLAQNPATRQLAEQLNALQPFTDLARGTALSNLQGLENTLQQIVRGSSIADAGALNVGLAGSGQIADLAAGAAAGSWSPAFESLQSQFQALQSAASLNGTLGAPVAAMSRMLTAIGSGDARQVARELVPTQQQPSLLRTVGEGVLSSGLAGIGSAAAGMLELPGLGDTSSPELQPVMNDIRQQLMQMISLSQRRQQIVSLERDAQRLAERSAASPLAFARELMRG